MQRRDVSSREHSETCPFFTKESLCPQRNAAIPHEKLSGGAGMRVPLSKIVRDFAYQLIGARGSADQPFSDSCPPQVNCITHGHWMCPRGLARSC
jgi:hypothetical protein